MSGAVFFGALFHAQVGVFGGGYPAEAEVLLPMWSIFKVVSVVTARTSLGDYVTLPQDWKRRMLLKARCLLRPLLVVDLEWVSPVHLISNRSAVLTTELGTGLRSASTGLLEQEAVRTPAVLEMPQRGREGTPATRAPSPPKRKRKAATLQALQVPSPAPLSGAAESPCDPTVVSPPAAAHLPPPKRKGKGKRQHTAPAAPAAAPAAPPQPPSFGPAEASCERGEG